MVASVKEMMKSIEMSERVQARLETFYSQLEEAGITFNPYASMEIGRLTTGFYWTESSNPNHLKRLDGEADYYLGAFDFLIQDKGRIRLQTRHILAHNVCKFFEEVYVSSTHNLYDSLAHDEICLLNGETLEVAIQSHLMCQHLIRTYQQPSQTDRVGQFIQTLQAEGTYLEEGFFQENESSVVEMADPFAEEILEIKADHHYRIESANLEFVKSPSQSVWNLKEVYHLNHASKVATPSPSFGAHSDVYLQSLEDLKGFKEAGIE